MEENQQVPKMSTIQETLSANYLSATSFFENTHVVNDELASSTAREKALYFLKILTTVARNPSLTLVQEDKMHFGDLKVLRVK